MQFAIILLVLLVVAGSASIVEAGCVACPKGYGYWHSKEACVPKIEGFVGTPPKATWVPPLKHNYSGSGPDLPYDDGTPQNDR